jgi:hypothetical protein
MIIIIDIQMASYINNMNFHSDKRNRRPSLTDRYNFLRIHIFVMHIIPGVEFLNIATIFPGSLLSAYSGVQFMHFW